MADTVSVPATRELRALRLYEEHGHEIERIGEDVYRVPSCTGTGFYTVRYGDVEACDCSDFAFGRGERSCKHLLCVGIAHAKRRFRRPEVLAGDPFAYAGQARASECSACFGGYVTIGVEEDGDERLEAVPCRRCADSC